MRLERLQCGIVAGIRDGQHHDFIGRLHRLDVFAAIDMRCTGMAGQLPVQLRCNVNAACAVP